MAGYPAYLSAYHGLAAVAAPVSFTSAWNGHERPKAFSRHGLALKLYFVAAGPKGMQSDPPTTAAGICRVEVRHPLDFAMSFLAHLGQGPQLICPSFALLQYFSTLWMIYLAAATTPFCWAYWYSCPRFCLHSQLSHGQESTTSWLLFTSPRCITWILDKEVHGKLGFAMRMIRDCTGIWRMN